MGHRIGHIALASALALALPWAATASDPVARAQAIIDEAQARGEGFGDLQAEARMVIRNGRGGEAVRALSIRILDLPGSASRGLTVVQAPPDVAGTGLLTHTDVNGDSEQWLYLPALKRVKRIAASGRSGPFMGSEFSFEDFGAQAPEQYHFEWLRDESLDGVPCHVLRRTPKDARASAYDHQLIWLDAEHLRLQRAEYFDRRGERMKVLTARGYARYGPDQRYWRAEQLVMRNVRSQAETVLEWSDIRIGVGLSERDFDTNALKAAR